MNNEQTEFINNDSTYNTMINPSIIFPIKKNYNINNDIDKVHQIKQTNELKNKENCVEKLINISDCDGTNTKLEVLNSNTDNDNNNRKFFLAPECTQGQLTDSSFDPWDDSINDNQFILTNKIMRIFPQLKNSNNYSKLKIDDESLTYITIREIADLTSKIICHHLIKYNLNPQKVKIIDYTAGVGGNVLSFSKFFNKVYAVEINKNRYEYLKNNVDVYECKNVLCVNDSSINFNENFLVEINPNVIFIDPPWGGNNYRETQSLKLNLGGVGIENLVIDIFSRLYQYTIKNDIMTTEINNKKIYRQNIFHNKFVIIKLPKNYDIEYFYETIKKNNIPNHTICSYLYILNKMLIIVCEFFCIAD
jgi:16S rRNA G966 N2-methylase RsmD